LGQVFWVNKKKITLPCKKTGMTLRALIFLLVFILTGTIVKGQLPKDSISNRKQEKSKKGWGFGAVPALAFDSDVGYKYGALVNLFNYGNGAIYPNYLYSIYTELSRTTKGSGINRVFFDSKYLLPKDIRITSDLAYLTEKALDFYGFNGYQAQYNSDLEDDSKPGYISRVYYRNERKLARITTDLQGQIRGGKLKWLAGVGYYNNKIKSVDIKALNKGLSKNKLLPDTAGLYDNYVAWGVIPEKQKNGGAIGFFKIGLVYDTRDNDPNPMHGIWTEAFLINAPKATAKNDLHYSQLIIIHRQYFTLLENKLSLACRIAYQGKLTGQMPYYMLPFIISTYDTRDGLGGSKNLRGILRDRVTGDAISYANIELRWKFLRTILFNQNIYFALSGFADAGVVVKKYHFNTSLLSPEQLQTVEAGKETPHLSYGSGLHAALNQNFILSVDYGRAQDKRDGKQGLYIATNFLF
jgi:hypothetical protein